MMLYLAVVTQVSIGGVYILVAGAAVILRRAD